MKTKTRPPFIMIAAAVLLCLVLVSASLTSGMFARYTARANNPEDDLAARTAGFNASAEAPTDPVTIIANGTDENGKAEYLVKVKNDSETAVKYEAKVVFPEDPTTHVSDADKFDNDQLTFTGTLDPKEEKEETLTFDMSAYFQTNDKYNTFRNDDMSGNKGKAPFDVDVKFTQIN